MLLLGGASQAVQGTGACTPTRPRSLSRPETWRSIVLEQGFGATRLNTGEMTNVATLAAALLANFRTIRLPSSQQREQHPDWWTMVKARRAAHRAVHAHRDRLRQRLVERGFRCFLDRMEADPAGGWLLHFFVADEAALTLLDELTEGACGPGDALSFDAEEFVLERIRHLIENDTHS